MKRYNDIFPKIVDMENLKEAFKNAKKGKSHYHEVKMVEKDPDFYLSEIQQMLINGTYKTSKYETFIKNDKGKEREIYKLPFYPDRIIHWAIMLQLEPIFMKTFTTFTNASLKDRGIHRTLDQLDKMLLDEEGTKYCLKIDIEKFFPNINHDILKGLLRKKFKDKLLLNLLDEIIDSIDGEKGVPIGNYLSQYFANFYLAYFDHWLKETKKCKYVLRYMDDIVILHGDKNFLHQLRKDISIYLDKNLSLKLKDNWQVYPVDSRGIDFVGYKTFRKYKLLRKSTYKRMKTKCIKLEKKSLLSFSDFCSVNSYLGWIKWCNGHNLSEKYIIKLLDKDYKDLRGEIHNGRK